jgi:hypothetical protein
MEEDTESSIISLISSGKRTPTLTESDEIWYGKLNRKDDVFLVAVKRHHFIVASFCHRMMHPPNRRPQTDVALYEAIQRNDTIAQYYLEGIIKTQEHI